MSWQASVISFVLRNTFKRRLARRTEIGPIREVFDGAKPIEPKSCRFESAQVGSIPGEWITHRTIPATATLLYLHGGGYFACSPRTHRAATSFFAARGFRVFAPDYRLAPEHRFPAGIEDAVTAYRGLLASGIDARQIAVSGDSAGGGLSLALVLSLRDRGLPLPGALALFSPVTDMSASGNSIRANSKRCAMFSSELFPRGAQFYLGDQDRLTPLASPLFAKLEGLPPMLIHVGLNETLLDDSVRFAERAKTAGIDVTLRQWPTVPHVWQLMHALVPEGRESLNEAATFLHQRLNA
jgi:acetyl esterase/lipase